MPRNHCPNLAQGYSPSSFFSLGTLLVASSIQFPSTECFSSKGLPTNTRSSRHGSSASFTNSALSTKNTFHMKMACFPVMIFGIEGLNSSITSPQFVTIQNNLFKISKEVREVIPYEVFLWRLQVEQEKEMRFWITNSPVIGCTVRVKPKLFCLYPFPNFWHFLKLNRLHTILNSWAWDQGSHTLLTEPERHP